MKSWLFNYYTSDNISSYSTKCWSCGCYTRNQSWISWYNIRKINNITRTISKSYILKTRIFAKDALKINIPELKRKSITLKTPKICRFSSQKHNTIIHRQGINEVNELNNFRTVVDVVIFFRTSLSPTAPIIKNILMNIHQMIFMYLMKYYQLT